VGETGGKRWHRLGRVDRGGVDLTVQLNRDHGEIVGERSSRGDKVGALLDSSLTSSLVGFEDDHAKVLGSKEGSDRALDQVELLLEPLDRLGKTGEGLGLSVRAKNELQATTHETKTLRLTFRDGSRCNASARVPRASERKEGVQDRCAP
jgi:hypothetical protein